jgi:formylglycine-generating enzyme required for sulfatase activity
MKSDHGNQSHAAVSRLVVLFVLMTAVHLSAARQVGPDAPKPSVKRPPIMLEEKAHPRAKPAPTKHAPRVIELKNDALVALRKNFVPIPAGEFTMGSENGNSDERPAHLVRFSRAFEMGKYEITQAQWQVLMDANPSHFHGSSLPVDSVSWNDAQQFIQRLNAQNDGYVYRLPTEAEWEYASSAGSNGDYAGNLNDIAWCNENSGDRTHPVGQKKPNLWGLYDMQGNVSEWCQDWYDAKYYMGRPSVDPRGPNSGSLRVLRGCSMLNPARGCRSALRGWGPASNRTDSLGFRVARTPR